MTGLTIRFGKEAIGDSRRKIGEVAIDSAKLVVADKADIQEHWTEVGKDRIGVIPLSTLRDDTLLRKLRTSESISVGFSRTHHAPP